MSIFKNDLDYRKDIEKPFIDLGKKDIKDIGLGDVQTLTVFKIFSKVNGKLLSPYQRNLYKVGHLYKAEKGIFWYSNTDKAVLDSNIINTSSVLYDCEAYGNMNCNSSTYFKVIKPSKRVYSYTYSLLEAFEYYYIHSNIVAFINFVKQTCYNWESFKNKYPLIKELYERPFDPLTSIDLSIALTQFDIVKNPKAIEDLKRLVDYRNNWLKMNVDK